MIDVPHQGLKADKHLNFFNVPVERSIMEGIWDVRILQVVNAMSVLGSRRSVLAEEIQDPFPSDCKDSWNVTCTKAP
jgi:hypothetical protein